MPSCEGFGTPTCCCVDVCRHYVMFVGNTGTGKTANIMSKLSRMDPEVMMYTTINMNSFSDAPSLQVMMEQPLEKKSGVRYGPPGARRYGHNGNSVCPGRSARLLGSVHALKECGMLHEGACSICLVPDLSL